MSQISAVSQRLVGKTVLITGASSGIGRSIALEFARTADVKLILTARRLEALDEVAAMTNYKVLTAKLDISKPAEIQHFFAKSAT